MLRRWTYIPVVIIALLHVTCSPKHVEDYHFHPVSIPSTVSPQSQRSYLVSHYWDNFPFADTLFVHRADSTEMMRAFVEFIRITGPLDTLPMCDLMRRASCTPQAFSYFSTLSEKVLHDPNSPFRSDELYIQVLRAMTVSPYLDQYEKIGPEYDLRVASQNRIGRMSNDFRYTTRNGRQYHMHDLKADYTILFINNPGCPMCREVIESLRSSRIIDSLLGARRLQVLAIYPDEDLTEWRKHMPDMDPRWINGYDRGCRISENELYDLKAIPALYLLSSDKTVLVKDSTSVPEIEASICSSESAR